MGIPMPTIGVAAGFTANIMGDENLLQEPSISKLDDFLDPLDVVWHVGHLTDLKALIPKISPPLGLIGETFPWNLAWRMFFSGSLPHFPF